MRGGEEDTGVVGDVDGLDGRVVVYGVGGGHGDVLGGFAGGKHV